LTKEDFKTISHFKVKQIYALGYIVKNIFNNIDLGMICMSTVRSLDSDFKMTFLQYQGMQINLLQKINEIVEDIAVSTDVVMNNSDFYGVRYRVSQGSHGYQLIENKDKESHSYKQDPLKEREDHIEIANEYADDAHAIDNIFLLGQTCYNNMSYEQVGILAACLSKCALDQSYIKEHKHEKEIRQSISPILNFIEENK